MIQVTIKFNYEEGEQGGSKLSTENCNKIIEAISGFAYDIEIHEEEVEG